MNPLNIINEEYKRLSNYSGYSLREFARYLDIDPSTLSKILSGKRGIPKSHASKMANRLFSTPDERDQFIEAVLNFRTSEAYPKKFSELKLDQESSKDMFFIISQWEYFAILNVLKIRNFDHTVAFIAKSLNISTKRVNQCLEVLEDNGFISVHDGKIKREVRKLNTTNDTLSRALKLAHLEELELAKSKIEVDIEKKYYQSNTFTLSQKDVKRIKKVIDEMNSKTNRISDKSEPDEVYVLSCQLFPLTNCELTAKQQ